MAKIGYFISDHGLGHASRSLAVIRSLLNCDLDLIIEIFSSKPLPFLKKALISSEYENRVFFYDHKNDFGFIPEYKYGNINPQKTKEALQNWVNEWNTNLLYDLFQIVKQRNYTLIISDISPHIFLIAEKLNVPSIAISNFTWYNIYETLGCSSSLLKTLWNAYRAASFAMLLPFDLKNPMFQSTFQTNLVSRNSTRSASEMYDYLQIDHENLVIYVGTGLSMSNPFLTEWTLHSPESTFILGGVSSISHPQIRTISPDDPEGQDYIACSDVALIKYGYSSVAEAIRAQVPILGVDFAQTAESKHIKRIVEKLGIGTSISIDDFFSGKWNTKLSKIKDLKENYKSLPPRFTKLGEQQIATHILTFLDDLSNESFSL